MTDYDKLKIEHEKLRGEFIGTLSAIKFWDITPQQKELLENLIVRLGD